MISPRLPPQQASTSPSLADDGWVIRRSNQHLLFEQHRVQLQPNFWRRHRRRSRWYGHPPTKAARESPSDLPQHHKVGPDDKPGGRNGLLGTRSCPGRSRPISSLDALGHCVRLDGSRNASSELGRWVYRAPFAPSAARRWQTHRLTQDSHHFHGCAVSHQSL